MKKILLLVSALLIGLLPFLPQPEAEQGAGFTTFLGRFHILLLHFPVVLVPVLAVAEFAKWRWPGFDPGKLGSLLWLVTLVSCLGTVTAGYLLYLSGDYQGSLVRNHLWGGVLLTLVLAGAAYLRFFTAGRTAPYALGLLGLAAGIVIYTSHQGGSLTHGPEFLTEYAPTLQKEQPSAAEQKPPQELLVFQDLIMPVLDNRCLSCHNEYKTKGDLLMTSFAALTKGGKSGKPILTAGQPEQSELYVRVSLPMNDDDHMPPPEKPAMTEDELALIKWWIEQGADPEMMLGEGPAGPEGTALLERYLPTLFRAQRLKIKQQQELDDLQKELDKLAEKLNLVIEPDKDAPGFFAVSLPMPPPVVNDETISGLMPYAEVFSKVSLPGAVITDDGLYELGKMTNLQKLYLPKTCVKGPGLAYLQELEALRELNLSFTALDDTGLLYLLKLPQLEKVYLFGNEVEDKVLEALRKHLPDMEILEAEGEYF